MNPLPPLQPTSNFFSPYQQHFTLPVSNYHDNKIVDSRQLFPQRFIERSTRMQCQEVKHEEDLHNARVVICKPQTYTKRLDEIQQEPRGSVIQLSEPRVAHNDKFGAKMKESFKPVKILELEDVPIAGPSVVPEFINR